MARKVELVSSSSGEDERGKYTKYTYSDGTEYMTRACVRDTSSDEDMNAAAYIDRIAPQTVPFEDYLAGVGQSRSEWWRQREEAALSELYNCPIKTTIVSRAG